MTASTKTFRDTFTISKEIVNWFPAHMSGSFKHMQSKMRVVDCVVEVHDSRVPFTGRNPMFIKSLMGDRPHILVFNKVDLIDTSQIKHIRCKYKEENQENIIFTNCLRESCSGLKRILPMAKNLMFESSAKPRSKDSRYKMMVVGIPNVGKSSLINALRNKNLHKGKATRVGGVAGVTRAVQNEIKISSDPLVYLIDTPGIMMPKVVDVESGMKLALCSCLKDDLVGIITIADFLLYWMNKTGNFIYLEKFELTEPTDNVFPLLVKIAVENNKMLKIKNLVKNTVETVPDINFAANHMVRLFRKKEFGDLNLDQKYFC